MRVTRITAHMVGLQERMKGPRYERYQQTKLANVIFTQAHANCKLQANKRTRSKLQSCYQRQATSHHRGHVNGLEAARTTLQTAGFTVIAGFISPSHAAYVDPKCKALKTFAFTAADRLDFVRQACAGSDWLEAAGWECSSSRSGWPDYPVGKKSIHLL